MKIEMYESLLYSWLHHIRPCQMVQTNWKASPFWDIKEEEKLKKLMLTVNEYFYNKYKFNIFMKNESIPQIIQQGEGDLLGFSTKNNSNQFCAVLPYQRKDSIEEDVSTVIKNIIRVAICVYGYLESNNAEILLVSPKISSNIINTLIICIKETNEIFEKQGFGFAAVLVANEDFDDIILQPVLQFSTEVGDMSEYFIRNCKFISLCEQNNENKSISQKVPVASDNAETVQLQSDNYSNDPNIFLNGFKKYLKAKEYTEGTSNNYVGAVKKVIRWEKVNNIADFAEQFNEIHSKYDKNGIYEEIGAKNNHAIICALDRFAEYLKFIIKASSTSQST